MRGWFVGYLVFVTVGLTYCITIAVMHR